MTEEREREKEIIEIKISSFPLEVIDMFLNILGSSRSEVIEFIIRKWLLANLTMLQSLGLQERFLSIVSKWRQT